MFPPPCRVAGSRGIGDGYFPKDGNGGYDVGRYHVHDIYRLRSTRPARTVVNGLR